MDRNDAELLLEKAVDLHGHLGPFLVIGVKMSLVAKKHFESDRKSKSLLHAILKTRLFPPFSCIIDGVQAATSCTVGNQKLKIEESTKEVAACFRLTNSGRMLKVSVKRDVLESLKKQLVNGADVELLAADLLRMPDEQLFVLEES